MNKRLNGKKAISSIVNYIQEAYKHYDQTPVRLHISLTLRDITTALLCEKALGKDNIEVSFYGGYVFPNSLVDTGLDFSDIDKVVNLSNRGLVDVRKMRNKDYVNRIMDKIDISDANKYLTEYIEMFLFKVFENNGFYSEKEFKVNSDSFGDVIAYKDLIQNRFDGALNFSNYFTNTIFPLYWFTNEEVNIISYYLGLYMPISFIKYHLVQLIDQKDEDFINGMKLATSVRPEIETLGYFNHIMDNIPDSGRNDILCLTHFFMGECFACYESYDSLDDFEGDCLNTIKL